MSIRLRIVPRNFLFPAGFFISRTTRDWIVAATFPLLTCLTSVAIANHPVAKQDSDNASLLATDPGEVWFRQCIEAAKRGEALPWTPNDGLRWSSVDDSFSFHFDGSLYGPMTKSGEGDRYFRRLIGESRDHSNCLVYAGIDGLPRGIFLDDRFFVVNSEEWYVEPEHRWAFVVDGDHAFEFMDSQACPLEASNLIRLDLIPWLNSLIGKSAQHTEWDRTSRTLSLLDKDGSRVRIRLRTPTDALRCSTSLSEIIYLGNNDSALTLNTFVVTHNQSTAKLIQVDELQVLLSSKEVKSLPQDQKRDDHSKELAHQAWKKIPGVYLPQVLKFENLNQPPIQEALLKSISEARDLMQNLAGVEPMKLERFIYQLTLNIAELSTAIDESFQNHKMTLGLDDPHLRWKGIELILGPSGALLLHNDILGRLLFVRAVNLEMKSQLALSLKRIGIPPVQFETVDWSEMDPRLKSALFAARNWPVEAEEITACADAVGDAPEGSHFESLMIETLLSLDALDRIPATKLNRWWSQQGGQSAPARRREILQLLTLQPSGQSWLLERVEQHDDPPTIREAARTVLRNRADATMALERFDFMPKELCQRIQAIHLPEPETPKNPPQPLPFPP